MLHVFVASPGNRYITLLLLTLTWYVSKYTGNKMFAATGSSFQIQSRRNYTFVRRDYAFVNIGRRIKV